MEDDEPDIFLPNLIERYNAKPAALNEMCLPEFSIWYHVSGSKGQDDASDNVDSVTRSEKAGHVIVLSNNLGNMKKKE